MKKLALLLAAVLGMSLALTACGGAASSSAATSASSGTTAAATGEKILTIQIGPNTETIDPALNSAVDGGNMLLFAFDCLLNIAEDGSTIPGAAESYEVSEDQLTWTFHLRKDLKWSDGTPLTANDFVYSWKRIADPATAAPYAETILGSVAGFEEATAGDIDKLGVTAPDDTTFVVTLGKPCTFFDKIAAFATTSPVQQATVEANGDAWATQPETYITNGAFYISEWVPDSHILFSKNPNFWNADAVKLDGIKCLLIEDPNAAYSAYQTGEALMIKDVPTEEIPSLEGNADFHIAPILGTYYIDLNYTLEQFQDPRVCTALSLAIDRDYVAETLMQGTYSAATALVGQGWYDTDGTVFADNANGGKPYIDNSDFEGNLEKAKQLLADAGYPNGEGFPTISYVTNDAGYHKVVGEYLQQAWKELGLTVSVEVVEWASFTSMRRAGDYGVARDGWVGDYSDPSNILDNLYSSNGNNNSKYASADFDAAMDTARSTIDPEERSAALHKAEDIAMTDMSVIPVAFYNDFWLQSDKITGDWHSPYGYWYFQYADIAE
ncbi:MAG: peptide ABC transporter substrate-binding protein [Ruminococcaceae bacterium]|nr:peptide ABC transporter substrate-binding protein [Oscillospiraceae bacterium]